LLLANNSDMAGGAEDEVTLRLIYMAWPPLVVGGSETASQILRLSSNLVLPVWHSLPNSDSHPS